MNKKLVWIIVSLLVLILLLVILKKAGVIGKDEGIRVSVEKVNKHTIIETVTASGKIYPEVEVKMSSDISGEIVELNVQEGDSVKKGQQLAKIYADIYSNQRNQAAAQVNQQEAMVENVNATLPGLKASMDVAQAQYDRQKTLLTQKVISQSEFETAETNLRTAQANYNAALQNVHSTMAAVASAKANLAIQAENVSRTTISSPINGVVSLLSVKKGERVAGNMMTAGTEIMRVADMSKIEAVVDVGENDITKVHLGDTANVEVDAYNNRKFKGVVTQIASSIVSTAASSSSSSTNDVTNYKVHIRLDPATYKDLMDNKRPKSLVFRPGMTASADIQTKTHTDVLSVPINAVTTREKAGSSLTASKDQKPQDDDNGDPKPAGSTGDLDEVVFLLQPDKSVKQVLVKTDIQDINNIEIVSGLKPGDEVVTGPYGTVSKILKNGTKVVVVDKDKLFEAKK
ncbi:MAG TPA: efflux transporter periplasmic adaptor subunit [Chitinophagaceae bacterium]|jgi:HlyD family secretion protein|nr:efflux transporter periplasmic adaptor subunit [Chitinophagaceae bacterium]